MTYRRGDHVKLRHHIGSVEILELVGGRYYVLDRSREETYHLYEDDLAEKIPETIQV